MVLFSALVPLYVVCKSRKEFIIDYAGLVIKAMMLCLAHYGQLLTDVEVHVGASLLLVIQFVLFMILRPQQYTGKHDQAAKLASLNFIDFLMYLILCISSIASMFASLFAEAMTDRRFHTIFLVLFALNVIYVLVWFLTVLKYGWKHFSITPKYAGLYSVLTCGKQQPKPKEQAPGLTEIELQQQGEVDADKAQDLQKLEILISHLQDRKKDLHTKGKEENPKEKTNEPTS